MRFPVHLRALTALALGALSAGCSTDSPSTPGSRFAIRAAALTLGPIGDASYAITVRNAAPPPADVVWSRDGLTADRYGDGAGAISYVGPCDATSNPHIIELVLESLSDANGVPLAPDTWANPAPPGRPVALTVDCVENQDTAVVFNLTVMRDAQQGFFDVAVNIQDMFCSAKVDCVDALLHDGDVRAPTVVLGFACTSGMGSGGAEPTWLHLTDIVLSCNGQPPLYFDPTGPTGNNGALGPAPTFFDTAIYRGQEELTGVDKCYWNSAFGVRLGADALGCRLTAQGTASHESFGADGLSPANTVHPYIAFDVTLTDAEGQLVCSNNALDAPGSGVQTAYTAPTGAGFTHEWQCDPTGSPLGQHLGCEGTLTGDPLVALMPTPDGFSLDVGGVRSPPYTLPAGVHVGNDATCCVNPCCDLSAGP